MYLLQLFEGFYRIYQTISATFICLIRHFFNQYNNCIEHASMHLTIACTCINVVIILRDIPAPYIPSQRLRACQRKYRRGVCLYVSSHS